MAGNFKSIDIDEAERVKKMIQMESENAKNAIRKVYKAPDELGSFQGNRADKFRSQTQSEMQKLENAIIAVDEAAKALQAAITSFMNADN